MRNHPRRSATLTAAETEAQATAGVSSIGLAIAAHRDPTGCWRFEAIDQATGVVVSRHGVNANSRIGRAFEGIALALQSSKG